jgi:hypothetical protein
MGPGLPGHHTLTGHQASGGRPENAWSLLTRHTELDNLDRAIREVNKGLVRTYSALGAKLPRAGGPLWLR